MAGTVATAQAERRAHLLEMLAAALAAVDPAGAVERTLRTSTPISGPVTVVAIGKAAPAMARGAHRVLGPNLVGGVVVSDHAEAVPVMLDLAVTSHPIPDASSLAAGERVLDLVARTGGHILFLISGGGSSLAEVPAPGVGFADLVETGRLLVDAGIPIDEMNTVRTHLSALKGGRLAAAAAAPHTTILVSDIPIGDTCLVASGPTVSARTSPSDALGILERGNLRHRVPPSVIGHLESAEAPPAVEAPYFVAAGGPTAGRAAVAASEARGIDAALAGTVLAGPAREMAGAALDAALPDRITVLTGETTVAVRGSGLGGRNQEAALVASQEIAGSDTVFVAFGTDGVDGPTDAAGAMVDGDTDRRIRSVGIDPAAALAENDSHPALDAAGALIRCGPTGTNVADLWLIDRR